MANESILVPVQMDANIFRRFSWFNVFRRQRRWRPVVIFAAILTAFAIVCFAMRPIAGQSALLGGVLLAIGVGLPIVYIGSFWSSLQSQIRRFGLDKNSLSAYTLEFSQAADCVQIQTSTERVSYPWGEVYAAYRVSHAIYLYVTIQKAFLLPAGQIPGGADALWALLRTRISAEKLHDARVAARRA